MSTPETSPSFPSIAELAAQMPQFEILEQISAGQESAVYHARQPILDREVMIRILIEPDPATAARFMQRLQMRAKLSHPRVVSIYDFGRTLGGQLFLSSEHVNGRVLREMIQGREVPPKLAFSLAMQCCELMQELHDEGQLHGALDARCVLVQPDGHIKWTGIGMGLTAEGEPSWLHGREASKEDDLWALGSLLHELFAREPLQREPRISRDIPPAFAAVIRRCISLDKERGLCTAKQVKEALVDALELQRNKATGKTPQPTPKADQTPAPTAAPAATQAPKAAAPTTEVSAHAGPPAMQAPRPEPRPHRGPSLITRFNEFLWGLLRFSLHAGIFLVTVTILTISYLLKDKIIINDGGSAAPALAPTPRAVVVPPPAPATKKNAAQPAIEPAPNPPSAEQLLEGLRRRYLNRLKDATQAALDRVKLDDLPFYRNELDLIQSGGEVPQIHEANAPQALKDLRDEYHQQRQRLLKRSRP